MSTEAPLADPHGTPPPKKAKGLSAWLSAHKVEATVIGAGGLLVLVLVKNKLSGSSSSSSAPATTIQPAAVYPTGSGGGGGNISSLQSQIASLDTAVSGLANQVNAQSPQMTSALSNWYSSNPTGAAQQQYQQQVTQQLNSSPAGQLQLRQALQTWYNADPTGAAQQAYAAKVAQAMKAGA